MSEVEKYKLKRLIEELKSKRGRGTELISLYIPAGRPLADIMNILRQEYSTATNIKDRTTRHHVLDALTSVMQRLKLFRTTPPNGLIIFCGYVVRGAPGDEKLEIHVLEPPYRLKVYLYRCDSVFHTEILEDMLEEEEVYGFIAVDRSEAAFAILRGKNLEIVEKITSGVPGKHRAGGQSARRFERVIEQLAHEFYKRIGEYAEKIFLNVAGLKGIVIGGPGFTKNEFVEGDYLHYELKNKVLAVLDIGYSGEEGIYELLRRSQEILTDAKFFRERQLMQEFLDHIVRDTGLAVYGYKEILKALQMGVVKVLLVSEKVNLLFMRLACPRCGHVVEEVAKEDAPSIDKKCPKCGSIMAVEEEKQLIDKLLELAEQTGAEVEIVSSRTEEGEALRRSFGGVAAILRFRMEL